MTERSNDPGRDLPAEAGYPYPPPPPPPREYMPHPGPHSSSPPDPDAMYKDSISYGLWCLCVFGLAGVHRIYMGKYGTGILWLLTWGLFGIGQFIDLFRMKKLVKDANIREGYLPHPRLAQRLVSQEPPRVPPPPRRTTQQVLLNAAKENGGALTVTQGVLATGLTFEEVEEILREMVAKGYVDVDNAPQSGVVVYRFPELAGPFS